MEESFWHTAVSIGYSESIKQDKRWLSLKQLEDKYGVDEAAEMVEGKLLMELRVIESFVEP
eukprot:1394637-Pyramimonas_sp.AAC.1